MIAAIIEFRLRPGAAPRYAVLAERMHAAVQGIDGFLSVARFESPAESGLFLSLSYWRDPQALASWRRHPDHVAVMAEGRSAIFAGYRIVIAEVQRDYSSAAPIT